MSHVQDIEALLNDLVPFAEKMLTENREFLPFGGFMKPSGEIVWNGAYNGDELPLSQDLIDILRDSFKAQAQKHELRACAIVYDIRTIPPGRSKKQDAICVEVDHLDGFSAEIIYPYKFAFLGKLAVEEGYSHHGNAAIFPRPNA